MADRRFKAVVLDLFDTLVDWDANRLPVMHWHGREIRSTLPWVMPKLEETLGPRFEAGAFVAAYGAALEEVNAEREREGIEIPCSERFLRALKRLDAADGADLRALAEALTRAHLDGIRSVTSAPAARVEAVRRLRRHYRLGLLSNFDDSAAGREILADTGVGGLFDAVIISADVGLRKPHPRIFERMLAMLGLGADEVLFAGDTPQDDVAGSKRAGMHAAWISRHGLALPGALPEPDIIIRDLAELPGVLEC